MPSQTAIIIAALKLTALLVNVSKFGMLLVCKILKVRSQTTGARRRSECGLFLLGILPPQVYPRTSQTDSFTAIGSTELTARGVQKQSSVPS